MTTITEETNPVLVTTIPNVELVSVGEWNAATGFVIFTADHLAAAVAALDDPAVHAPRLRIGHTSPSTTAEMSAGGFEEQPAFGRFENLRLNATGTTIVADAVGVPAWLADILPSAFPSRSIEGYWNVQTAQGRTHEFVITSVALLGVSMPAVETLEDLRLAYGAEMPDGVEFVSGDRVAATRGGQMPKERVSASVTYTDVRHSFYEDLAVDDRYWWWICDFVMSPATVIADDDEGGLWSVPYTLGADETVSWGEPIEVRVQYVETASGKVAAQKPADESGHHAEYVTGPEGARLAAAPANPFFTAASSRPSDRVPAAKTTKEEGMTGIAPATVLERLGLPEDATEEQVLAALDAEETTETNEETPAVTPPVAASGVTVDEATWKQTQEDAAAGREARAEQIKARQVAKVDAAIRAGKLMPSRRDHYLSLMEKDEDGTATFIDGLAAGQIPVDEKGHVPDTTAATNDQVAAGLAAMGVTTTRKENV